MGNLNLLIIGIARTLARSAAPVARELAQWLACQTSGANQLRQFHLGADGDGDVAADDSHTSLVHPMTKQLVHSSGLSHLLTQERLPKKIPKKGAHPVKVNEEEAPICQKLHQKYGDDYEKLGCNHFVTIRQL